MASIASVLFVYSDNIAVYKAPKKKKGFK